MLRFSTAHNPLILNQYLCVPCNLLAGTSFTALKKCGDISGSTNCIRPVGPLQHQHAEQDCLGLFSSLEHAVAAGIRSTSATMAATACICICRKDSKSVWTKRA